jgi:hypothetical protein
MGFTKKQKQYSILLIFSILVISYFSFFDDYFKYLEVKSIFQETHNNLSEDDSSYYESDFFEASMDYYISFPDGYFIEEVRELDKVLEIEYERDILLVRDFINDYPISEHFSFVRLLNMEIWNDEIRRYDSIVKSNDIFDPDAVEFFRTLLHSMRDQNKSTIYIDLSGLIDLKDFEDYNSEIRNGLDEITLYAKNRKVSDNIANITSNYSEGDIEGYEEIIIKSIDSSFENILSNNFITIESMNQISTTISNPLLIQIDYTIKNQHMEKYGKPEWPNIWEYFEESNNKFLSYLIGVSIEFDFAFNISDSDEIYEFRYESNPLTSIENITSLQEAYKEMTKQNFQDFSNTITNNFGIYTTGESSTKENWESFELESCKYDLMSEMKTDTDMKEILSQAGKTFDEFTTCLCEKLEENFDSYDIASASFMIMTDEESLDLWLSCIE